jgi:hypothetical protein
LWVGSIAGSTGNVVVVEVVVVVGVSELVVVAGADVVVDCASVVVVSSLSVVAQLVKTSAMTATATVVPCVVDLIRDTPVASASQ